jgi:hypothetical protein
MEQMGMDVLEAGTWGDISLSADILTAVKVWESIIWLIWAEAGGHGPLDHPGTSRFGLASGVANMIAFRFPAPTIILMLEFVVGRVALDQWQRRTVVGADKPSWMKEASRMHHREELKVYEMHQLVSHMMSSGLKPLASLPAASTTTALPPPSPLLASSKLKRNADGLTKFQQQVYTARVAAGNTPAVAKQQVLALPETDLLAERAKLEKARKLALPPKAPKTPKGAAAAGQAQPQQQNQQWPQQPQQQYSHLTPQQLQQQQQQPGMWPVGLPTPTSGPPNHWQQPQLMAPPPSPWWPPQPPSGPPPVSAPLALTGPPPPLALTGPPRESEPAAMQRVAALVDAGQLACISVDVDAVRAFDVLAMRGGVQPAPCAWRALFKLGHANCDPQRKCKCNRTGAVAYNAAAEGPLGLKVKALVAAGSSAALRLVI